jgi:hypothetical protein
MHTPNKIPSKKLNFYSQTFNLLLDSTKDSADLQGKTITRQNRDGKEKCNFVTDNWQNGIYFV